MKAELLSIGTELLLGQIVDTNANYLAGRLALLGIDCLHMQTVGDNLGRAKQAIERALGRSDLVVATGGLGPTEDDLTREAIAAALGETPSVDPALEAELVAWFSGRGLVMPDRNRKQAWLIPSARALPNPNGTAPGWDVRKDGKRIVAMPGVPREMTPMWESVEPSLTRGGALRWRTLKLLGIGESAVEEKLAELVHSTSPTVATYAKNDGVHVRVADKASDPEEADRHVATMEREIRARLGDYVWGADDETLASVIGRRLEAGSGVSPWRSLSRPVTSRGRWPTRLTPRAGSPARSSGRPRMRTRSTARVADSAPTSCSRRRTAPTRASSERSHPKGPDASRSGFALQPTDAGGRS